MTPQFKAAVETYGPRLMADLTLDKLKVAGIFGNLAVGSGEFEHLQEISPTVTGSRGGWGYRKHGSNLIPGPRSSARPRQPSRPCSFPSTAS